MTRQHLETLTVRVQDLIPTDVFRLFDLDVISTPSHNERHDNEGGQYTLLDTLRKYPREVYWRDRGNIGGEAWRYLYDTGLDNEGDETLRLLNGRTAETHLVMRISNDGPISRPDGEYLYIAASRIAPVTVQIVVDPVKI